jgi:hypothetical protein
MMRLDPLPVFFSRARIDDEQQVICGETINEKIVNDCPMRGCQRGVLRLAVYEFGYIVGR